MNFEEFQKLELKYAVEDIKVNGIQLWPVLRIYIASQIAFHQDRTVGINRSILLSGFKYLFFGIRHLFKKTDYLFFSASEQRKKIGQAFVDRADIVSNLLPNTLIVEFPANGRHLEKKYYPNNHLISKYPFYFIVTLLSKCIFRYHIEGQHIFNEILQESGVSIDFTKRFKIFLAERKLMNFLIKWKKLKGLWILTPYTNMGYVYSFKENHLPVIEFQHGSITNTHFAYNINKQFDHKFYPDQLLTFGRKEVRVFEKGNHYIDQSKVTPVGSFTIDGILTSKPNDLKFAAIKEKFKKVVAYTAQDALEKQFIPFLKSIAELDPSIAYILIPRFKDQTYYSHFGFPENVLFVSWLTTYELMYLSDYHSTINSTTALEAPSLGTINILTNAENRSKEYFESMLDGRICKFADTPEEYIRFIHEPQTLTKEEVGALNREIFEPDFYKNIEPIVDKIKSAH